MESIKNFLKSNKFLPSKKMGQNFLHNQDVINKICENIPTQKECGYDCILEIGPGLGAITKHLVKLGIPVIAIELDKRLYANLKQKFLKNKNLSIINDDFLTLDLKSITQNYKNIIVIANIPYSITTPIVLKCLGFQKIQTLYIMVQKELADKWTMYKKTSNRNATTNILNYYFCITKKFDIKNTNFIPAPKVDSSMIVLSRWYSDVLYDPKFFQFMKPFFLAKRKKLLNNLPKGIDKAKLKNILIEWGMDENVRAEQLDYSHWLDLYTTFKK